MPSLIETTFFCFSTKYQSAFRDNIPYIWVLFVITDNDALNW